MTKNIYGNHPLVYRSRKPDDKRKQKTLLAGDKLQVWKEIQI